MHRTSITHGLSVLTIGLVLSTVLVGRVWSQDKAEQSVPIAILGVQEKGQNVEGLGAKISALLYAELSTHPDMVLVEREELDKVLKEAQLSLSGLVDPATATRVGNLTGAKILLSLSVLELDQNTYVVAKIIGTETSRVIGASAKSPMSEGLEMLVQRISETIKTTIMTRSAELLPKPVDSQDRIALIAKAIGKEPRPTIAINVPEKHIQRQIADPAVLTELTYILKELGFTVYESGSPQARAADIQISGAGTTEFATQREGLYAVRGRLELTCVHNEDKSVLAVDRQTNIVVELSEQIASKSALQQATGDVAQRLIPKMMDAFKKKKKTK